MGQIKASTIQQRFGFVDGDLKTPKHDEIMLWLDENIQSILSDRYKNITWRQEDIDTVINVHPELSGKDLPDYPYDKLLVTKSIWEHPITSKEYIVGFVDLRVKFIAPSLGHEDDKETQVRWRKVEGSDRWAISSEFHYINFEVKSSIASLGELIRQIRFYQQYDKDAIYIVVCPDDRFSEQLKAQGIGFLKYPL